MAVDSIAAAIADIYGELTAGGNPTGVTAAYNHEEAPGNMQRPVSLTVSIGGVDSEFFTVAVRLYVDITADAKTAQSNMAAAMETIENKTSAQWGPVNWQVGHHPEIDGTLLAEWMAQCGREDF